MSQHPRNDHDLPDEFEDVVLTGFDEPGASDEYYEVVEDENGSPTFRYMSAMRIKRECLDCHGSPAGTVDKSGYEREGMGEGDLYGALSMSIPMAPYVAAARQNMVSSVTVSALMMLALIAAIALALRRLVTRPLRALEHGMDSFEAGDYGVRLERDLSTRESAALIDGFNDMADRIQDDRDNLESKVAERTSELSRANEELEDRRLALAAANAQLEADNKYKADFLAMMSHELKTPLAASMAFTGILRERNEGGPDERAMWDELEEDHRNLLVMIENILEMARIDAGREELHLELVDVGDLIGYLQASVAPLAQKAGLAMTFECEGDVPLFIADPNKLNRILQNLAGNAIKFTEPGGSVVVCIRYDKLGDAVEFEVRDTGIGISPEDQELVFERFVQVDSSSSRAYGGSGLGLATVKELAAMHGGTCTLQSELGKGSKFTVRIPGRIATGEE